MRWLAVLTLVTGCDRVFNLDALPARTAIDAKSDGNDSVDGDVTNLPSLCASPQLVDDFAAMTLPYCPWGYAYGDNLLQHDSVLDITLSGTTPNMSGCTTASNYNFTSHGVLLQVPLANATSVAYTTMTLRGANSNGSMFQASIAYKAGTLSFTVNGTTAANLQAPAPLWWQLRALTNTVEAYTSADGEHWQVLGTIGTPPPEQIAADIGTGLNVVPTIPGGNAQLGLFAICN